MNASARQDTKPHTLAELERRLADLDLHPQADPAERLAPLNDLAWELVDIDSARAQALGTAALALASATGDETPGSASHDELGRAAALRTLGYLAMRSGDYTQGLPQLTQALAILETHGHADAPTDPLPSPDSGPDPGPLPGSLAGLLADVYDGLVGIYAQCGIYPDALDLMHKHLAAAERSGDRRRMANAMNNLAHGLRELGEPQRAAATLRQTLALAEEIGHVRAECLALLNLALMHQLAGEAAQALAYARHGLERCRAAGFEQFTVHAYEILGSSHLLAGDVPAALHCLEQALAGARAIQSPVAAVRILVQLGAAQQAAGRLDQALDLAQQGAALAEQLSDRYLLADAHKLLAELYEQTGDLGLALDHFKHYHAIQAQAADEHNRRRLQILQVAHDTALAQQEAAQLRALAGQLEQQVAERTTALSATVAQLRREVAERKRAEAEIQELVDLLERRVAERTDELATFFDLALLANQGGPLADVFDQVLVRILEVTRSRAVCLHFRDAAGPAGPTLALVAEAGLAEAEQAALRLVPLDGPFAVWLERPNDPQATTELASAPVPGPLRLARFRTYLGAQVKVGGRPEGVLGCYRLTDRGYGIDEVALVTALAEQIGTMLETQRLRRKAEEAAVLAERQRLARDLHDSVTQSLYSLTLFSRAGREAAADGDAARLEHSLAELEQNTLHALREMRLLLYELRPADVAREGLKRALELRLNTVERRAGLRLEVTLADLPPLPPAYEVDLYHIVVEALNNVVKHAAARRLVVCLQVNAATGPCRDTSATANTAGDTAADTAGGALHLRIADDGRGFDPATVAAGLGLSHLHERIARLGGSLTLTSALGHGTQLDATIPYAVESTPWPH